MKKTSAFDWVIGAAAYLAGILLVGTVLIVCFEICMRYFFKAPQIWTVEVCEYILFFITFLGTPWLLKVGGHVNIDVVLTHFGKKGQNIIGVFSSAIGVFISGVICFFAMKTSWDCYTSGVVVTKTITISKHYFLVMIGIGYFLLLLEFGRQGFNHFRSLREGD